MSKQVMYSPNVGRDVVVDLPTDLVDAAVSVESAFTRRRSDSAKMDKPARGSQFDPSDEGVVVFWLLRIEGHDESLFCLSTEQLNKIDGFKDSINIDGFAASFKDGASITTSGGEILFTTAA